MMNDAPNRNAADVGDVPSRSDTVGDPPKVETIEPDRYRPAGLIWLGKVGVHAVVLLAVFALGISLVGWAQRVGWIRDASGTTRESGPRGDGETNYICPMMCTPPSKQPGRCPVCGMELVVAASVGGDGRSVTIEAAARRMVGIQTAKAKLGPVSQTIRTIGSIQYDESRLATISAHVGGRIEELYANYVGVPVQRYDDLALLYSPDLYSAQIEYLTAIERGGLERLGGAESLAEIAEQNLIELGLTENQVAQLRERGKADSRIRIKSPINGTVVAKHPVEGDYLKAGDSIFRIADLSTVWLMLDLFPDDAGRIRFGQQVEADITSSPGELFNGRIAFIDPTVDPDTRTVRIRVEMPNTDGKLRPGDYAGARVYVPAVRQDQVYDPVLAGKYISPMHPQVIRDAAGDCPICGMELIPTTRLGFSEQPLPDQQVVTIPRNAVLMAGGNSVIYIETDPGRFEIRRVTVGPMTDKDVVILEGVNAGETVAISGNFLIDSQMQLAGNPSLMDPSKASIYPPGPLPLPQRVPLLLAGDAGDQFDRALSSYFTIQQTLAADRTPPPVAVNTLDDALSHLLRSGDVPEQAQSHLQRAKRSVERLTGSIEQARKGFRPLSHSLLRAANVVRGPDTTLRLVHMFCPMVPGGGGDWMQPGGDLVNPYWGSKMLSCGETVLDMKVAEPVKAEVR